MIYEIQDGVQNGKNGTIVHSLREITFVLRLCTYIVLSKRSISWYELRSDFTKKVNNKKIKVTYNYKMAATL